MAELAHLEFLVTKSKELIQKQVDSYRQLHNYAGTVIGVSTLYVPFFLNGLDRAYPLVQHLSVVPVALFVWAILLMLDIFRSRPLKQTFVVSKYAELANAPLSEVLAYEIGANTSFYTHNKPIAESANRKYNTGVVLTIVAIISSIILLLTNNFVKPDKADDPIKVELVHHPVAMTQPIKNEQTTTTPTTTTTSPVTTTPQPIVIPSVSPNEGESMNEGVDEPNTTPVETPRQ